jgi:mono/diheme cytochrome c family protein
MKLRLSLTESLLAAVLLGGLGIAVWQISSANSVPATDNIKVPRLSAQASAGKTAFDANCAQCHGVNASGTTLGPPLLHDTYNPGHHADEAFYRAVRQGVTQHHWPFGNMPPLPQVTDAQLPMIVRYVRELQVANGIFYRPHQM